MEKKFTKTATRAAGQQLSIDIKKTLPFICDNEGCGSDVFIPAMKFRKVPKLMTGSKEDQLLPVQVMMCVSCGIIPEQFDIHIES